jgi:hypothetical protein
VREQEHVEAILQIVATAGISDVVRTASGWPSPLAAVQPHHDPQIGFHISTFRGRFQDAVRFATRSVALVFIAPTGWTGYPYSAIGPLLRRAPGEVLINFMYDHINRFAASDDPNIIQSLDPILGGPGWKERLERERGGGRKAVPRSPAARRCF